ncbi:MAG: hypothetical protein C6I05_05465 [Epsilonproteobacteria bacterium]|nr:hypothetical protein [Nitratiruptor sp.]MRJ02881.1 hypothetical protein [Campylobacterota bacterium]NPA82974.1 ATP-binding protein [Campylobacterota bacterium]
MIESIYLFNSGGFGYAKVDLERDLFFFGENGSGKTTFIRAIHYLYSGDTTKVGIPPDKQSFKEYYFPYANSYIVYTFSTFFIFVLKSGGELLKYFCKGSFNPEAIIEGGIVRSREEVRSYLKGFPHKLVRGVKEYSDILYGKRRGLEDFQIAKVRNKERFLKLFQTIFNVDRAIIDAKSIKEALFFALEGEFEHKSFDVGRYLHLVDEFRSRYNFFIAMKHHSKRIEKLEELKRSLLALENRIEELSGAFLYRRSFEERERERLEGEMEGLKGEMERLRLSLEGQRRQRDHIHERCDRRIANLTGKLRYIEELQREFTREKIEEAKRLVASKRGLKREYERLKGVELALVGRLDSIAQSIERQVHQLERSIEELELEKQRRLLVERELLQERREREERQIEDEVQGLRRVIEQIHGELSLLQQELLRQKSTLFEEYRRQVESAEEKRDQALRELHRELERLVRERRRREALVEEIKVQIGLLQNQREQIQERYEEARLEIEQQAQRERELLEAERTGLLQFLAPPPGSFWEFLDQEAPGWEEELYPLLDRELLFSSIEELRPRITARPLIGVEVVPPKRLPTREEIDVQLAQLQQREQTLEESLKGHMKRLQEERDRELLQLSAKIDLEMKRLQELEGEIRKLEEQERGIQEREKELEIAFKRELQEIERKRSERERGIEEEFEGKERRLKEKLKGVREQIGRKERKREKIAQRSSASYREIVRKIEGEFQRRKEELEEQIATLRSRGEEMGEERYLQEVRQELALLEGKLEEVREAALFLKRYGELQETIEEYGKLQNQLARAKEVKGALLKRKRERIAHLRRAMEELQREVDRRGEELKKIEMGLKHSQQVATLETIERESHRYLIEIVQELERSWIDHQQKMVQLQTLLHRLSQIPNLHEYEINLAVEMDGERLLRDQSFLLEQIENFLELAQKRLDFIKREEQKRFANIFDNEIQLRLELLKSAHHSFQETITQINRNLKGADFGVVRDIRLLMGQKEESVAGYLHQIHQLMREQQLISQESLFFDSKGMGELLDQIHTLFNRLRKALKGDHVTLNDTIELDIEFVENGVRQRKNRIKNESSTGGSMLLKIAIAIAILKVYLQESPGVFFLIVDEVARLSHQNQRRLKEFANGRGFKIIFVTPDPILADHREFLYYKFVKGQRGFQVVQLNL